MACPNLTKVASLLASQFGDCEPFGSVDSDLHVAAFEGNTEVLAESLSRKPPREAIDKKNNFGCTPLRLAAAGGHKECVELLLSNEADVNVCDVKGQSALYVAVKNGHFSCAELLLQHGADPDGDASNRTSPLYVASMNGRSDIVKLLLNYNAGIILHRQSLTGAPFAVDPVKLALTYHHYDCVKLLLAAGGRPLHMQQTASPFTGITSLYHVAMRHNCGAEFAELLFEFGLVPWVADSKGVYPWDPRVRHGLAPSPESEEMLAFINRVS
ncbi:hypothetical protein BaRGS_00022930, partial [Batillaria attramentaria]